MEYKEIVRELEFQLKDYVGNKKAIIGISGGIDSAVVATLCSRILGRENVFGVLMPYGTQGTEDARSVVDFLGIKNQEVNIKEIVDKFNFLNLSKVSKGNIMARVRMTFLYAFANELSGLVIGTGNKSEIEVGYFTKYGDGGVDVEPIGNLYKTEIYGIARFLKIPEKIINKKPSAELWDGQTDEDDLGLSYKELDKVLKEELNSGEAYEKIDILKSKAEHKRKMPPIFRIRREK